MIKINFWDLVIGFSLAGLVVGIFGDDNEEIKDELKKTKEELQNMKSELEEVKTEQQRLRYEIGY